MAPGTNWSAASLKDDLQQHRTPGNRRSPAQSRSGSATGEAEWRTSPGWSASSSATPIRRRRRTRLSSPLLVVVHSTSPALAARRARVAGGAEEPLLARRVRSSKRRRHDAHAAPRRRRTRARSRRLSLGLREQFCSPARTPRCRSSSDPRVLDARIRRWPAFALPASGTERFASGLLAEQDRRWTGHAATRCGVR